MNLKKTLCQVVNYLFKENFTHIDQIHYSISGRELFEIANKFSLTTMKQYYKRELRVTRLLYFIIGVIAIIVFNLIF